MLERFSGFIREHNLFRPGEKILLAVSGGVDSVVMCELFYRAGVSFGLAHCNFTLRGKESDGDEAFVKVLAAKYKAPFFSKRFSTKKYAQESSLSTQMAARELRYRWFSEIVSKEGFACTATAHHRDDAAETFFINLLRGSGISGFHGIPLKQEKVIRPLLFATREEIEAFAKKAGLGYRQDSSNLQDDYLRNRLRHRLLPVLKEIDSNYVQTLFETTQKIRDAEILYRKELERAAKKITRVSGGAVHISISGLKALDPLPAYLFEWLRPFGFRGKQVTSIIRSLTGQAGKQFLSPTHRLLRDRDELIITERKKNKENEVSISSRLTRITVPVQMRILSKTAGKRYQAPASKNMACLDASKLEFPLVLRKWQQGDRFYPLGMKQPKKLSDFFIDNKVPLSVKENTRVLVSGKNICWVVGHRIDERYRITEATEKIKLFELL